MKIVFCSLSRLRERAGVRAPGASERVRSCSLSRLRERVGVRAPGASERIRP